MGAGWRMRTAAWVLRPSGAASSGAQSLFPSRGKASGRARLVSVRSVRVFPRFFRLVALFFAPKIVRLLETVQFARVIHTHTHTRDIEIHTTVELVVAKRIERSLCLSSSGKCHGDIGTPVRVSFEFLEVFFFVEEEGSTRRKGKL